MSKIDIRVRKRNFGAVNDFIVGNNGEIVYSASIGRWVNIIVRFDDIMDCLELNKLITEIN